jgi:alpha-ribazole phosphatase/probable phosphoglycerate mutase
MAEVATFLRDEPIVAIYASPLRRTVESAQSLGAASRAMHVVPALREMDFGEIEGMKFDEIAQRYPDLYRQWMDSPSEVRFPGGECLADLKTRVLTAFEEIVKQWKDRTIAIVAHGGVNRVMIASALQIPDDCLFRIGQDYGSASLVTLTDGVPSVELLNHRPRKHTGESNAL